MVLPLRVTYSSQFLIKNLNCNIWDKYQLKHVLNACMKNICEVYEKCAIYLPETTDKFTLLHL